MVDSRTQKQLKILSAVNKLHHDVGAELSLELVGGKIVNALAEITDCDACAILLIEEEKIRVLAENGFTSSLMSISFSLDMQAIANILKTKEAIFSNDLQNDVALSTCVPKGCVAQSLICVPILVQDEVKGIIHLDSLKKNAFDEDDLNLAKLLAKEAAIALERSFLYEQIKALTLTDALTGCYNRRKLEEDLKSELARSRRYARPLSLLMIDIDWFKNYNDYHGHSKGDDALKKIASILINNVRAIDRVYRYGGEEFVIILPEVDKEGAMACAERLRRKVEMEPIEGERESQPSGKLTISVGVASFPLDAQDEEKLIEAADLALYRAKALGRNRVCIF
ncbi:sensor domain-containing diguanylate cyclase [bacterium]|nr:sensor domain-containing diguanylate cyclase [bacterium]